MAEAQEDTAKLAGGRHGVRPEPGGGRARPKRVRGAERAGQPTLPRALIADPDPDVLASTALLVTSLGYEPMQVSDPAEILETIERERPGLVLLEPVFPGLNLSGFLAALRSHTETNSIPLAFYSASKELAPTAARHQVWGTLAKPFSVRELGVILNRALGPSPAMLQAGMERDIEKDVRAAFHDYRNMLTAFGNYIALLQKSPDLAPPARMAVNRLQELALKMETKTEHLRAYVLSLMLPFAEAEAPQGHRQAGAHTTPGADDPAASHSSQP